MMFFCGLSILCILIFSVNFQTHLMFHKRQWSIWNSLGHASFSERCVLFTAGWEKKSLISCCWPLYPWFYVFLNPDGENRKGVDPHFMEFLPNQFFSHWFLRVNCTSCKWCFPIVKGNILVIVAFRLMLGVLDVFSDRVYLVCCHCLSAACLLLLLCCSTTALLHWFNEKYHLSLCIFTHSFSGKHFQVLLTAGGMPLGFLHIFSQLVWHR